ncbi:hypothetical protein M404DRAFT_995674 [Pisolithus tinctorius Marx 270]|uniref:Uncharacterized protein n=1 Tax=Pisolithus tinctorius Marx 270 TaxID=870435 RepID=A0A0C3JMS1_PISTI|nr:hypothetical protein M404DRAFT_995674 [Pisolithus tinctorius Marx 270]
MDHRLRAAFRIVDNVADIVQKKDLPRYSTFHTIHLRMHICTYTFGETVHRCRGITGQLPGRAHS